MAMRWRRITVTTASAGLVLPGAGLAAQAHASPAAAYLSGQNRPQITGPGLAGPGFYNASGGCS